VTKSDAPQSYAIIDKQIPYVPEHCLNGNLILSYHGFTLYYQHSLTGITFTTTDNKSAIPSYHIANAGCSKSIKIRNCNSTAFLNVMNLFDTNYQVIAYRPMPGRWFMAGLNIQITKT
jgi:iron complex outermembrane receptor protein